MASAKQVLDGDDLRRAVTRIGHEITERNGGTDVVLVGLQTGGVPIAHRLAASLANIEPDAPPVPVATLDVGLHRDDIGLRPFSPQAATDIPFDLRGRTVVLVDDVLYTGRTVRAALDALGHYGRPAVVQLAVMVDRGHRELPIRPDFVGKNLPTSRDEAIDVREDGVYLLREARSEAVGVGGPPPHRDEGLPEES